jgi:hypothetical protein
MKSRLVRVSFMLLFAAAAAACGKSSTSPSDTSSSDSSGSVSTSSVTGSVTTPKTLQPANGSQVRNADQPLLLVVQNAVTTKSGSTTYTFEVATDAAFAVKVQTKDNVAEGTGGQTGVTLDVLPPGKDYYWHARAKSAGTTGVFSATAKFTLGPQVSLNAPTPVAPANGSTTAGWPTFRVNNATTTGGSVGGAVVYKFEVATSAAFTTIVLTGQAPETPGQTSFTPPGSQPAPSQTALFWRATATDQTSGAVSPASTVQTFVYGPPTQQGALAAQEGLVLWSGQQPTGTNGHAVMGTNWQVRTVTSFDGVTHVVPTLEELQIFDLLDRGFDPNGAITWMTSHGYSTSAAWYPGPAVIGFPFEYLALVNGQWEMVIRVGG